MGRGRWRSSLLRHPDAKFSDEIGGIGKEKKKTIETRAADAAEALCSPDSRSLTLFCRIVGQLYLGGKMQVETNDLPPKEATQ